MAFAWLVLAPLGMQVARFGKAAAEMKGSADANDGKKASWFLWHRAVQTLVVVTSAVGVLSIILAINDSNLPHFDSTHSILGTLTSALMLLQMVAGIVRPAKDSSLRYAWQLGHKCCGYATWVLAMITCILGSLKLPDVLALNSQTKDDTSIWVVVLVLGLISIGSMAILEYYRVHQLQQKRAEVPDDGKELVPVGA